MLLAFQLRLHWYGISASFALNFSFVMPQNFVECENGAEHTYAEINKTVH